MYENIFDQISNAAEKRYLKESTIRQYYYAVSYFLRCTNKPVSELTIDDVDALIILTGWEDFKIFDLSEMKRRMEQKIIFDMCDVISDDIVDEYFEICKINLK